MKLRGYKTDNLRIVRLEIMEFFFFFSKDGLITPSEIEIFNLIRFSLLCHVSYLIFNFVPNELLSVKIEESKSN